MPLELKTEKEVVLNMVQKKQKINFIKYHYVSSQYSKKKTSG